MSEEKNEKPTQIKKTASYTYWVDEKNKSRELPQEHRPKKVSPPPLHDQPIQSTGPSKWNTLGSWQERSVSMKELNEAIEVNVKEWLSDNQCELELKEVSLSGEQIFSNNKRKVLYEITGNLKFEGEDLQLVLDEITCTGDRDFTIKGKNKQQKSKLQTQGEKLIDVIVQVFGRFKE